MKTTIRVHYDGTVRQSDVADGDLRWFVSCLIGELLSDAEPRVKGFTVQRGETRREHFQRLQKDDPDIFEQ